MNTALSPLGGLAHLFAPEIPAQVAEVLPTECVCVWESPGMPGIIQIGRTAEGASAAAWVLASPTGEAHFRVTYFLRSADAEGVEQRLRAALESDGIRHHEGFYFTPRRFAIQLLEQEARLGGVAVNVSGRRAQMRALRALAAVMVLAATGAGMVWHAPVKVVAEKALAR